MTSSRVKMFALLRSFTRGCYLYYGANAKENITLLRTLAGPGGTGVNGCCRC